MPPPSVKAPVLVSSLTSVEICSEMRPGASTTGVKDRPTPNCLKSIGDVAVAVAATGTGNSPPARNFAVSPDTAVRLGSASICTRPTCSSALSAPCTLFGDAAGAAVVKAVSGLSVVLLRTADLTRLAARQIAERAAEQAEWLAVDDATIGTPRDDRGAGQVDAELLGDVALHFGDAHLEHHLLAAGDASAC